MPDIKKGISVRTEQDADQRVQIKIVDGTTVGQVAQVDVDKAVKVLATGHDAGGTNRTVLTSTTGQVHVIVDDPGSDGTTIADFKDDTAIAAGGTATHTYTVTALKTFHLEGIIFSASARAKAEIKVGPTGSEVTKAVMFTLNSDTQEISFTSPIPVVAGDNVLVVKTNTEPLDAQDVYSTILGYEI